MKILQNYHKNLLIILIIVFISSLVILFQDLTRPITGHHGFRQTQTALTVSYFLENGFELNYKTPVLGPPWTIPFEFPYYQFLVLKTYDFTHFSLEASGRVISILHLIFSLFLTYFIFRALNFEVYTSGILAAGLLSNPHSLFWGQSFLIETSALALNLLFFLTAIHLLKSHRKVWIILYFLWFFAILSGKLKIVT